MEGVTMSHRRPRPTSRAQSLVEYVLLLGMVFLLIAFFTLFVGGQLLDVFNHFINDVSNVST